MCASEVGRFFKSGMDSLARTSVGQKVLGLGDKLLSILDDCLKWSLPAPEKTEETNGEPFGKPELPRPLPWVLFLPALLIIRIARCALDVGTYLLGMEPYEPAQMVRIIRAARRRLSESRSNALKNSRQSKTSSSEQDRSESLRDASKSLVKSLRLTLSALSCLDSGFKTPSPPPTEIRVSSMFDDDAPEDHGFTANGESSKKRKSEDIESSDEEEDESVIRQIDRYADIPSDEDSDFKPNKLESDNSLSDITEDSISDEEVSSLQKESNEIVNKDGELNSSRFRDKNNSHVMKMSAGANNDVKEMNNKLITAEKDQGARPADLYPPSNGVGDDRAYYSPVSWKSVSPDISLPSDRHVEFIENEVKTEELSNGEIGKVSEDNNDSPGSSIGEIGNGHLKESNGASKRQTTSHAGKHHHQQHQKTKRGNHAGRKKK